MNGSLPEIDYKEVCRYMGLKMRDADRRILDAVDRCARDLREAVRPRWTHRRFPLTVVTEDAADTCGRSVPRLLFAGMDVRSEKLAKNLSGCREVFLFAGTLGIEADLLIRRAEIGRISDAVIYQAAAAAQIEACCDEWNEELREAVRAEGRSLRPRFSPGYGDFSLAHQAEFLNVLGAQRAIGLTLTEGCLLLPTKSVTAVIGITDEAPDAERAEGESACGEHKEKSCAECGLADCAYRR